MGWTAIGLGGLIIGLCCLGVFFQGRRIRKCRQCGTLVVTMICMTGLDPGDLEVENIEEFGKCKRCGTKILDQRTRRGGISRIDF